MPSEINTYGGRETIPHHYNASEHAIIYVLGTEPKYLEGEKANGMRKDPIAIALDDQTIRYEPMSRVNFGRIQTFDWSIMAQLHGSVIQEHMFNLNTYYVQAQRDGLDRHDD